jgi:hypothetical protein
MDYKIARCQHVKLIALPNNEVKTFDGQLIQQGSIVFFRFAPTRVATEYLVISDYAIRRGDVVEVVAVGPHGIAVGRNIHDLVADPGVWWQFWCRRYGREDLHGE